MTSVRSARIFQAVGIIAWLLGLAAIVSVDSLVFLTLPAGVLLTGMGAALLCDWGGVRGSLHEAQIRFPSRYPSTERTTWWRLYGAGVVFVGVCWAAIGISALT
jgi:hypothetical protein